MNKSRTLWIVITLSIAMVGSIIVDFYGAQHIEAAKLESGVTINAPPPTTGTCPGPDENGDGVDDMTGEPCPALTAPTGTCPEGSDENGDGVDDNTGEPCPAPTAPSAGTCGLVIMDGVPINYGRINVGQASAEQIVEVRNEGTSQTPATIMIKGGDWIGAEELGNPIIFPPAITHVAMAPNLDYDNKKPLSSAGWELGQISGGESIPVYLQMKAAGAYDASNNMFIGDLHQDVTIDLLC